MTKLITPATREAIIAGLKAGLSQLRVSADCGVSQPVVSRLAREHGVGKRGRRVMSPERRKAIGTLLRLGVTVAEIGRRLKCTRRTVLQVKAEVEAEK